MQLADQIPGLAAAIEQEQHVRATAFLDLPEVIAGEDVPPLTLAHVLKLSIVGSPFLVGGPVSMLDVLAFLTALTGRKGWRRWLMFRRLSKLDAEAIAQQIADYLAESFQDAPGGAKADSGAEYYSNAASLVDLFAREYGWTERETLSIPLKRLFQYLKAIMRHHNPSVIMFNPSDKVRGQWLASVNRN